DLKVISGTDTNEFNPNGTLTRAAAAKIASLLKAGAYGQKIEWKSSTSYFDDVDPAHWGNAYINYAFQNGLMEGTGDGFKADATLSVAEAIVIAVKTAGYKSEVAALNELAPASYWAANWISVADTHGLTTKINVFDYSAACTRAQFAQIAYNVLIKVPAILNGFATNGDFSAFAPVEVTVTSVKDNKVSLSNGKVIDLATFEAALAANGIDKTAAELKGALIKVTASKNALYSVELVSGVNVYTYADGKIENMWKDNDTSKEMLNTIKIDGTVYAVNTVDSSDDQSVIGATTVVNGIYVEDETGNWAAAKKFPSYYKAVAYDDDADGEYDRLVIDTYYTATVDFGTNRKGNAVPDGVTVDDITFYNDNRFVNLYDDDTYKFTNYDFDNANKNEKAINYTGEAIPDETTPVLVNVKYNADTSKYDVDVLAVAETKTGVATNLKAGKYIVIDTQFNFAPEFKAPQNWVLGQNVTIYTINGKYVNVVNPGVEVGMETWTILVDNVTVADGVALIDGYKWNSNGTFTAVTDMKVVGYVNNTGRLLSMGSYENKNANNTDSKTYAGIVTLGTLKADGSKDVTKVDFADGALYTFDVTAAGAYFKASAGSINGYEAASATSKVEIKGQYIYENDVATRKLADAFSVLVKSVATDAEVKKNAYATDTFSLVSSFKFDSVKVAYLADNKTSVSGGQTTTKVALVYATNAGNTPVDGVQTKLNEGEIIVKIAYVENETLTESTYVGSNIMTGEKVTITGNASSNYVVVKDGKIVDAATLWVADALELDVAFTLDVRTLTGYNTKIVDPYKDGEKNYLAYNIPSDSKKATFGVDAVKYWAYNADGTIKEAGKLDDVLKTAGTVTFRGCIIDGTVVILDNVAYK
ncbi:MAG: S-layer homology domain-containing protein, partial [Clostridia bacterium]|nr:S-layer homology domain-containing protein [Clostridia bacterium]